MKKEMIQVVKLNDAELENIVGGKVHYINTSNPIIDANGGKRYEVFSGDGEVGNFCDIYKQGGAEAVSANFNFNYGSVAERKIQQYIDLLKRRNETIIEF